MGKEIFFYSNSKSRVYWWKCKGGKSEHNVTLHEKISQVLLERVCPWDTSPDLRFHPLSSITFFLLSLDISLCRNKKQILLAIPEQPAEIQGKIMREEKEEGAHDIKGTDLQRDKWNSIISIPYC